MKDTIPFSWPNYSTQFDFITNIYSPGDAYAQNKNGRTRDRGYYFNKLEMQLSLKHRKPYNPNTFLESDFEAYGLQTQIIQFEVGNYS